MRHINKIPDENEVNDVIKKYRLPFPVNGLENTSAKHVADFVFEHCKHLLPEELCHFFEGSDDYEKFEEDIKSYLIISWAMTDTFYNRPEYIESNFNLCKKMQRILVPREIEQGLCLKRSPSNNTKLLNSHVSVYLDLRISKRESKKYDTEEKELTKQADVPIFAAPFVMFLANYFDLVRFIGNSTEKIRVSNKINKDNLAGYLAASWSNFIHILGGLKGYKAYKNYNIFLFEKEFNIALASKILRLTAGLNESIKDEVVKVLSIAALLPNVNGRIQYLDMLFADPQHISFLNASVRSEWLSIITNNLLQMVYVTLPVMEKYFYGLMKSAMPAVVPEQQILIRKINGDMEPAELQRIINTIGVVLETSLTQKLDSLYLQVFKPVRPLEKNEWFDQIIFESEPRNVISKVVSSARELMFQEFRI